MENYTLGPPLKSYGPNIKVTAILVVVGLLLCLLVFAVAMEIKDATAWTIFYLLAVLYGGTVLRQLSSRVWLHETGVSWRGILGQGEMRWLDFGAISVDRSEGIAVRKWHSDKKVMWGEIEAYESSDAHFKIRRFKKYFTVNVSAEKIANTHVLCALLDGVMREVWQRGLSLMKDRTVT